MGNYLIGEYANIGLAAFFKKGSFVYHPSLGSEPIVTIDGNFTSKVKKASFYNAEGNEVFFHHFCDKVSVGAILALFQSKSETIKRVVCIAGVKASRSVSFSSNVSPADGSSRLRVRSMFLKISKTTVNSEILQVAGRVLGNFNYDVSEEYPQKIYCSAADCESIQKAYLTLEELMNHTSRKYGGNKKKFVVLANGRGAIVNTWLSKELPCLENMRTLLNEIEMSNFKCVVYMIDDEGKKKKITRKITARKAVVPKLVVDDHRGDTEEDYKFEHPMIVEESDEESEEDVEEPIEAGDCLLIPENGLSGQQKDTYDLIVDYLLENPTTEWTRTSIIETVMQDNGFFNLKRNGIPCTDTTKGMVVKKINERWYVKKNN